MVGMVLDDLHIVGRCVLADDIELVLRRILLVFGGHVDVLSCARMRHAVTDAEARSTLSPIRAYSLVKAVLEKTELLCSGNSRRF